MAKNAGRLAGLAALAGAAYMMSKGKDKDKEKGTTDSNPTRPARPEPTETRLKSPAESIAAADKSDKSTSISTKGAAGTTTPGPDTSVPRLDTEPNKPVKPTSVVSPEPRVTKSVSEPSDKSVKLAPENRDLEANTSRGTRTPAKPVSTVSSSAEGMKNYKPRRTTAAPSTTKSTVSSSAEGMKNYVPRKPVYRQETQQERAERYVAKRRAAQDAGMKRGGAVKMASGGMTASSRADGIASRGKTKCKMY